MKKNVEFGIKKQLITKEEIQKRLKELGKQITEDFKNESEPLIVIGLLKGSIVFMADLIREIRLPLEIDVQYIGFEIPNEFVVGYGLDFNEIYRNLEYVGIAEPSVFE